MSLLAYLAYKTIEPIIRKGFFSDEHVLFGEYMPRSQFLYEIGAVLGYTFRERIATFVKLFCELNRESELASWLGNSGTTRLQDFEAEPRHFFELHFMPEATRLIQVMRQAGLTRCSDWSDLPKIATQKLRPIDMYSSLQLAATEGIGLGCSRPELTVKLLAYQVDPAIWGELRSHGLDIPASPSPTKTLHQREAEARLLIMPYVSAERPDLLNALGLSR